MTPVKPLQAAVCSPHRTFNCPICSGRTVDTVIVQSPGDDIDPLIVAPLKGPELVSVQAASVKSQVVRNIKRGG